MVRNQRKNASRKQWQVEPADQGKRLVLFLHEKLDTKKLSARQIKRLLEQNACQINGHVERFASHSVKLGDHVTFTLPQESLSAAPDLPQALSPSWQIIHQDKDLLIVQKPSGIAIDTTDGKAALQKEFGQVFLVHRLDKDTSGLLLLARSKETAKAIEALFRAHDIKKGYLALVDGCVFEDSGEIRNHIGKVHSYQGQSLRGAVSPEKGRLAHTLWRVLGRGQGASLVACEPKTGRTHQIRVHMKGIGHPILGDYQYARSFHCPLRPARCLLHASELTFTHPTTQERKTYKSKLPDDFLQALHALKVPFARKALNAKKKQEQKQKEQGKQERLKQQEDS